MPVRLFKRNVQVEIGAEYGAPDAIVHPDSLRVVFSTQKTNQPDPPKAKVEIYNLNAKTRALCEEDDTVVTVKFSYGDIPPTAAVSVFTSTNVEHKKDGTDIVTTIEGQEGIFAWANARVVGKHFESGTLVTDLFKTVLNSFISTATAKKGIAISPLALSQIAENTAYASSEYLQEAIASYSTATENGVSMHDWSWRLLKQMCERHDLFPFWDSSVLHIAQENEPLFPSPIVAHKQSGMIGVPRKLDKYRVAFDHLLNPAFRVHGIARVSGSEFAVGDYLIESVGYSLDTHGGACTCTVEGEAIPS